MTIEEHGTLQTSAEITIEAIPKGTRTTIVETDSLNTLSPEKLGEEYEDYGNVTSSVVSRQNKTHDVKTTVCEKLDEEDEEFEIRVVSTASEEPIETHPAFSEDHDHFPWILAGTGDDPQNGAVFDGTESDSKFSYFPPDALLQLGGVTSYLVPSVVLEATKRFTDFDDVGWNQIYTVGKIKEPPIDIDVGNRTWLIIGAQYTNDNGTWVVTVQYQLSGEDGWNENMYLNA